MKDKKLLKQLIEVDTQTGEIKKTTHTFLVPKEPDYIKLYLDCLGTFTKNDGLDSSLNGMLLAVLKRMSYASDGQVVILNSYVKKEICIECKKSLKRLEQAISIWSKNKIILRVARGTYRINPIIFGKGDWKDIYNLRATFDFTLGTIETIREYKADNDINDNLTKDEPTPRQTKTSKELEELYKTLQELKEQRADLQGSERKAVQKQIDSINKKIKRREEKLRAIA